jgi:hypothetical protein
VVKELCFAIRGDFLSIGHEGDNANCLIVATEHDIYKNMGDIYVCTDFKMLKVKVPIIFLGTVGFSLPRMDVIPVPFLSSDSTGHLPTSQHAYYST